MMTLFVTTQCNESPLQSDWISINTILIKIVVTVHPEHVDIRDRAHGLQWMNLKTELMSLASLNSFIKYYIVSTLYIALLSILYVMRIVMWFHYASIMTGKIIEQNGNPEITV